MKIRSHSESHIVELDDGSRWQIFPGDLDVTLNWKPETELDVVATKGDVGSHALIGAGGVARVIRAGESWSVREVRSTLKNG
ncbi:hypothetical protein [Bradyrhizobium sp. CCGUVB23]|uniref:hypothetical protein n=1 Tax=Bradyrhizobium sp. CCGUVB23 TaxID=2949630 RepID=UPI0020B225B9|nr:hypothetical protein [Bradyrhizobium sp. CCGUVB23]MCP3459755.1 hypothetical protein [Bradyrhizobium sp. CCGUVB23]